MTTSSLPTTPKRLLPIALICATAITATAQYHYHQYPYAQPHAAQPQYAAPATAAAPAANQYIDPANFNEPLLSQMILDLTNAERTRAGLNPVSPHPAAAAAATQHSRDMASRGYFDHRSKGLIRRTTPAKRMASHGYQPRMSAENIAMIPTFNNQIIRTTSNRTQDVVAADHNTYQRLAQYAMREWMNSPGHRQNIMNPQLTTLGVGVAVGMRQNVPYVYLTQNFGG